VTSVSPSMSVSKRVGTHCDGGLFPFLASLIKAFFKHPSTPAGQWGLFGFCLPSLILPDSWLLFTPRPFFCHLPVSPPVTSEILPGVNHDVMFSLLATLRDSFRVAPASDPSPLLRGVSRWLKRYGVGVLTDIMACLSPRFFSFERDVFAPKDPL